MSAQLVVLRRCRHRQDEPPPPPAPSANFKQALAKVKAHLQEVEDDIDDALQAEEHSDQPA